MEHEEQADRLEREADKLEEESERVGGEIDDARAEWEAKAHDSTVPGAQPEPGEDLRADAGADEQDAPDEEEGEAVQERDESDQMPEEGPSQQVPEDEGRGAARDEAEDSPGVPDEDEQATGNPDAAGSSDPEESD